MDPNDPACSPPSSNRLSVVREDSQEIDNPTLITDDKDSDTSDFDVIELIADSRTSSKGIARFALVSGRRRKGFFVIGSNDL